jgi:hypothetical protein
VSPRTCAERSEPERKDKQRTLKLQLQSSIAHILATKAVILSLRAVLDSQPNFIQNGFLQFALHMCGSVAQRRATIGTSVRATIGPAANQRCATMGTVFIVVGVHMDRKMW